MYFRWNIFSWSTDNGCCWNGFAQRFWRRWWQKWQEDADQYDCATKERAIQKTPPTTENSVYRSVSAALLISSSFSHHSLIIFQSYSYLYQTTHRRGNIRAHWRNTKTAEIQMLLHSKKSCHWQIKRKNERKITNHVWNHLLFLIYFDFWALSKFEELSFCFLDSNAGRLNQIQVRLNDGKFSIIFEWFERILIINLVLFYRKRFWRKPTEKSEARE